MPGRAAARSRRPTRYGARCRVSRTGCAPTCSRSRSPTTWRASWSSRSSAAAISTRPARAGSLTLRHTPVPAGIAGKGAGWIAAGLMPRASPVMENLRAWVRYPAARPPDRCERTCCSSLCRIEGNLAVVGNECMVSKHRGGRAPPTRFRVAGRKGKQMKSASHRRGRTAVPAGIAIRQATRLLNRGRSGVLVLGLAAAAAVAVPASASASASNGPSPVVGHVYVNDNTKPANTIGAFDRHADGTLTPERRVPVLGRRGRDRLWAGLAGRAAILGGRPVPDCR